MKFISIVLLFDIVFQDSQCQKITKKVNKPLTKEGVYNANCKEIKCPIEKEPLCVRLQYGGGKTVYVVAYNRCEMQYFNCHKGLKVVEMPMKNCEDIHGKNNKHNTETENSKEDGDEDEDKDSNGISSLEQPLIADTETENSKEDGDEDEDKDSNGISSLEQPLIAVVESSEEDDSSEKSSIVQQYLIAHPGATFTYDDSGTDSESQDSNDAGTSGNQENRENEDISHDLGEKDPPSSLVAQGNIDDEEEEEHYVYKAPEAVDEEQYKADCPTVCPTRDVMLCARCTHGIYRTFPSVCHMRMYACKQPEEKMELISREPCIMSSPYLNDLRELKGTVAEHTDVDPVLQYINCKEYQRTGSHRQRARCIAAATQLKN